MTIQLSKFGEDFLKLALRIDKHNKGYVDFYIGPEYIRQTIESEPITSPTKLLKDSENLLKQLENQGYEKKRERYIFKHLTAMKTSIEILLEHEIPFKNIILKLFDTELYPIKDSVLYKIKEDFNNANEGVGSLEDRMKELRIKRTIPGKDIFNLFIKALTIVRNKTYRLFKNLLPDEEHISLEFVSQKDDEINYSYYESYLGNYLSKIKINPKYNMYWTSFLSASAHEGYPGHHTEFVLKEQLLYRRHFQFEHSILLFHSPKLIISEGIAEFAINMLYSYKEQSKISFNEFCPNKSQEDSLDKLTYQTSARRKVGYILYNLGYYTLVEGWSEDKLFQYADSFEIYSEKDIKNRIKMYNDPVLSIPPFSYYLGSKLITDKYGDFPKPEIFKKLLTNPVLPSDLI